MTSILVARVECVNGKLTPSLSYPEYNGYLYSGEYVILTRLNANETQTHRDKIKNLTMI